MEDFYWSQVVKFIREEIDITLMSVEEIKKKVKEIPYKSMAPNELDYRKRQYINTLVSNYGFLGSLVRLKKLIRQIESVTPKCKSFDIYVYLFKTGAKLLFEHIETYYIIDILYKMYVFFPLIKEGNFREEEFLASIDHESLVRFDNFSEMEQLSLQGFNDTEEICLHDLIDRFNKRDETYASLIKAIKKDFTSKEIIEYTYHLIEILLKYGNGEYEIIIKCLLKAGGKLTEGTKKYTPKRVPVGQIKIISLTTKK